jgi:N-dimethylarginine dimethylaminohydrolase
MKQTVFLGSPTFFESESDEVEKDKALAQWHDVKHHLESHKYQVKVIDGTKTLYDNVYITNTALIINDFAIIARFHKQARRGEEELTAHYLNHKLGLRLHYLPKEEGLYYEGEGDTRWSHHGTHIWFAYGVGRTTLKGIDAVERILQEELGPLAPIVHRVKLEDRKTFHLDLALLPLPNGRVLYYPTLSPASLKEIIEVFGKKNVIRVPLKYFYACNSVWLHSKTILCPKLVASGFKEWMEDATQMTVDQVDVSQFHLGNGSVQCMVLRWWNLPFPKSI